PEPPPVDVVVHAAAHVDEWSPWALHDAVTVGGTRAVLDTWPRARLVLISSASVYPLRSRDRGRRKGQVLSEDDAPTRRPLSSYARAKIAQEQLVRLRSDAVVLRPHAVHGPGDTTLLPRLSRARRHGRLLCPGGAQTLVHLTDVGLLAAAVVAACEVTEPRPTTPAPLCLNVADAEPLTLREVATGVAAANGWPERPLFTGSPAAWATALACEGAAHLVHARSAPLLTAYAVSHLAVSRTFATARMTAELGVVPRPTDLSRWVLSPSPTDDRP
ncbi:MAG: hypothetical protein JWP82_1994, partial [Humibacillus sp.]|nr:hypothetical protein [Humibacillus sp.]